MKTLKKRIQEEMILTDEDRLIFEILSEHPQLKEKEELGRELYKKFIVEKCNKCERTKCPHKHKPIFTKNWGFICFVNKVKAI